MNGQPVITPESARGSARSRRMTVIGAGYLGLTHAVAMAEMGHEVLAVDVDAGRIGLIAAGVAPFHETDLEPMLLRLTAAGRLRGTTSFEEAARFARIHFLCVGTPAHADGSADLGQIWAASASLAAHLRGRHLIVGKSTVPVGTCADLGRRIGREATAAEVEVAWNPEFLREGSAVADSLRPDRLVFGVASASAAAQLKQVYGKLITAGVPVVECAPETAELVKVAANAFLAIKLSFINALAEVCEATGAKATDLAGALALDARIGGGFLVPGLGYGGGCLPKDIKAFGHAADRLAVPELAAMLRSADAINCRCRSRTVSLARDMVGGNFSGRRIAVLGLAFKPGSDDIRDSPSLDVCRQIASEGATVSAHDPVAMIKASRVMPELRYAATPLEAAIEADCVLHLTDWPMYQDLDPFAMASVAARSCLIDARSALDGTVWEAAGWTLGALGQRASRHAPDPAAVMGQGEPSAPRSAKGNTERPWGESISAALYPDRS